MDDPGFYRGWRRPGPVPPGGIEPDEGETLDFICGHFRIFQYAKGHRYSTDDVLTAWYGTSNAPRVDRAADLGSGIGSVATIAAWKLPGATFCTVEAQEISLRLARKSMRYNGLDSRVTLYHGDLRDVIALNLDLAVFRRAARAAFLLERLRDARERLGGVREAAGNRDGLAGAALLVDADADGLLRRLEVFRRLELPFIAQAFRRIGVAGPDEFRGHCGRF